MKLIIDSLPVIVFLLAYYLSGKNFMVATGALVIASCVQLGLNWIKTRSVEKLHLYSCVLVVLLGGVTLAVDNPAYLQWKPTALYWLLALVLIGARLLGNNLTARGLTGMLKGSELRISEVPEQIWNRMNALAVLFLGLLGGANIYVAYNFSEEFWVNFKLFGLTGMTLLFMLLLFMNLSPYLKAPTPVRADDSADHRDQH